jgi:glutathione synthase
MRKDPPFDDTYLHATQLLELARGRTVLVNDPRGLRDANEKLYALHFPAVTPPTLVTREAARIKAFVREHGGRAVIKPLDGAGGRGVFVLSADDKNTNAIIETSTDEGRRAAMVQRYIPEVRQGDRRILLLDGEPLGGILRVPADDEARSNIHVGGRVVQHALTARDREICATIAPRLRADGLAFVGIDVIGDYLTEVNVTSPTGIQELDRLDGQDATGRTVAWIESKVAALRSA